MRYQIYVSPSLDGVLSHDALLYEGVRKPVEVLRARESPAYDPRSRKPHENKLLEQYFYDLYGVFMKKLSSFALSPDAGDAETVKLQALLQEMIKVKRLIRGSKGKG